MLLKDEYLLKKIYFFFFLKKHLDYTRHGIDYKDELDYRRKIALEFGVDPLVDGVLRR